MDVELTEEEIDVLRELIKGLTNSDIAKKLYMSVGTVKLRISDIFKKLKVRNRVDAAVHGLFFFLQLEHELDEKNIPYIPMRQICFDYILHGKDNY